MTRMPLVTGHPGISSEDALKLLGQHKIEKLPLVDDDGILRGLITLKDYVKSDKYPLATKDRKAASASARPLAPSATPGSGPCCSWRRAWTRWSPTPRMATAAPRWI
jgi:CBS-domain-containing membrane protein